MRVNAPLRNRAAAALRRVLVAALLPICMAQASPPGPHDLYGPLFEAVQSARIFPDSKSFADAVPKDRPDAILSAWRMEKPQGAAALRAFVLRHFEMPDGQIQPKEGLRDHIARLWPQLTRPPLDPPAGSSALALPYRYVVPGGRFREIYYWDSYFTMLGLKADGQIDLARQMVLNFESLIQRYGRIPNGSRTYYLGRSQPPFLSLMIDLIDDGDPKAAARHLAALQAEHRFWMAGTAQAATDGASERVIRMPDGSLLNRYWDDKSGPREESWSEDVETARQSGRAPDLMYRHLRAGAESGWDFSSRWLADGRTLATIHTTDIVPVDLNSLLWALERNIARRCGLVAERSCQRAFEDRALRRQRAMNRYLWSDREGRFGDWDHATGRMTPVVSAAALYPLFVGLATRKQADFSARIAERDLLAPGGLRTTRTATGQQWDWPNGWAPLQWVAIDGLERYGQHRLARTIAERWVETVRKGFNDSGKMLEKYNVEESVPGGGGEYPLQDGFGWTNGVTRALLDRFGMDTPS